MRTSLNEAGETADTVVGSKAGYIGAIFYCLATAFPKLSLCALYLRIFVHRRIRIITWVVVAFLVANCIAFTIASILICVPPSYYWKTYVFKPEDPKKQCINTNALSLAYNPPNIVSDVVMLALPVRTLWKMNVSKAKKAGFLGVFSTGSIGLAGSAARWAVYLGGSTNNAYSTPYLLESPARFYHQGMSRFHTDEIAINRERNDRHHIKPCRTNYVPRCRLLAAHEQSLDMQWFCTQA